MGPRRRSSRRCPRRCGKRYVCVCLVCFRRFCFVLFFSFLFGYGVGLVRDALGLSRCRRELRDGPTEPVQSQGPSGFHAAGKASVVSRVEGRGSRVESREPRVHPPSPIHHSRHPFFVVRSPLHPPPSPLHPPLHPSVCQICSSTASTALATALRAEVGSACAHHKHCQLHRAADAVSGRHARNSQVAAVGMDCEDASMRGAPVGAGGCGWAPGRVLADSRPGVAGPSIHASALVYGAMYSTVLHNSTTLPYYCTVQRYKLYCSVLCGTSVHILLQTSPYTYHLQYYFVHTTRTHPSFLPTVHTNTYTHAHTHTHTYIHLHTPCRAAFRPTTLRHRLTRLPSSTVLFVPRATETRPERFLARHPRPPDPEPPEKKLAGRPPRRDSGALRVSTRPWPEAPQVCEATSGAEARGFVVLDAAQLGPGRIHVSCQPGSGQSHPRRRGRSILQGHQAEEELSTALRPVTARHAPRQRRKPPARHPGGSHREHGSTHIRELPVDG